MLSLRSILGVSALLGVALSAGCDSPVCVFSGARCVKGGSGGGVGGIGTTSATFPEDGRFLSAAPPALVSVSPEIFDAHPETPIFLEFSESLDPDSLDDAFQILDVAFGTPALTTPPILVGDGRVVVLTPNVNVPFQEGRTYQVFYGEDQEIADLNGQTLGEVSLEDPLLQFTVDSSAATAPRVLYTFPTDFSIDQGNASQIVIGFDRQMDVSSFDQDTFNVLVDGGPPIVDPAPQPLSFGVGGTGLQQPQVWTWTPVDGAGRAQSVGVDARVQVLLSQGVGRLLDRDGEALLPTETEFQTLDFDLPTIVQKNPGAGAPGSFGRADVFGTDPIVDVTLSTPLPGGVSADIFTFGTSPTNFELTRSVASDVALAQGSTALSFTAAQLGLFDAAGDVQFADGDFEVAVQFRRNGRVTGVRRFDADPGTSELERPIIDTTVPVLLGLGTEGTITSAFVGDVRDLAVVGRASEPIAFAFVDAGADGTNGGSLADPPEAAFSASIPLSTEALFVAAPVAVGAVDPGAPLVGFELTVFDAARNAATLTAVGRFFQRGIVGPGGAPTGATVGVRVFDERTLLAIPNANVYSHRESGGAVTFVDQGVTNTAGFVQLSGAPSGNTVISVDAPGFDLFTFHGIPRDALDVLLTPSGNTLATTEGVVTSELSSQGFVGAGTRVSDTRSDRLMRFDDTSACLPGTMSGRFECPFGPVTIQGSRLGASTFFATQDSLAQTSFLALLYLRGFAITAPLGPVPAGGAELAVELDAQTSTTLLPILEQPLGIPPHILDISASTGLGTLDGDPLVSVETIAAGIPDPLLVGKGNPYPLAGSTWTVLGAVAGVAGPTGALTQRNAIDPSLFLRAAVRDTSGNEVAARPRIALSGNALNTIDVPLFLVPGAGGSTGGSAYNIVVRDTVPDAAGVEGFYRVVVTGPTGRRWILWRLDTNDAAGDVLLSVPDLAAQGGSMLPAGTQTAEVRVWASDLDRGLFLWSDIEREHEAFGRAATVSYTQN
ncbi:MAG: Ig-like domain-containing protein [Planctomycetota bacterium]